MASQIPTSTSISESAVIAAPLAAVWHLIKLPSFAAFWSKLAKAEEVKGASPETDVVKWTFKDGTVLDVKLEEHSVRSIFHLPFRASFACILSLNACRACPPARARSVSPGTYYPSD